LRDTSGYCGVSSDRQSENSIEDQRRICRGRAEREDWQIFAEFHDAAISGSTIRGTGRKANGMLRQRLYIGEIVWNRGYKVRDPVTGQAHSRTKPACEHVMGAAPYLRIIDDAVWEQVQQRLARESAPRFWEKGRPQQWLSGKLFCGVCDGPLSNADPGPMYQQGPCRAAAA